EGVRSLGREDELRQDVDGNRALRLRNRCRRQHREGAAQGGPRRARRQGSRRAVRALASVRSAEADLTSHHPPAAEDKPLNSPAGAQSPRPWPLSPPSPRLIRLTQLRKKPPGYTFAPRGCGGIGRR